MNMMEHIHLAGEDEEDMYSGYNDYNATLDTEVSHSRIIKCLCQILFERLAQIDNFCDLA